MSPRITGTSNLLLELICQSFRFNIQVDQLNNVNKQVGTGGDTVEPMYFEF